MSHLNELLPKIRKAFSTYIRDIERIESTEGLFLSPSIMFSPLAGAEEPSNQARSKAEKGLFIRKKSQKS